MQREQHNPLKTSWWHVVELVNLENSKKRFNIVVCMKAKSE